MANHGRAELAGVGGRLPIGTSITVPIPWRAARSGRTFWDAPAFGTGTRAVDLLVSVGVRNSLVERDKERC
jgi:hypothetical protein